MVPSLYTYRIWGSGSEKNMDPHLYPHHAKIKFKLIHGDICYAIENMEMSII